jgi:hypothetical protein
MREPDKPCYETTVIIDCCAGIITDSYGMEVESARWPGLPVKPPRRSFRRLELHTREGGPGASAIRHLPRGGDDSRRLPPAGWHFPAGSAI